MNEAWIAGELYHRVEIAYSLKGENRRCVVYTKDPEWVDVAINQNAQTLAKKIAEEKLVEIIKNKIVRFLDL